MQVKPVGVVTLLSMTESKYLMDFFNVYYELDYILWRKNWGF